MTRFVLQTKALPSASRRLSKAAVCILGETLRDKDLLYNLDLVLSEACANVVRHAYDDRVRGDIQIVITIDRPRTIKLEVADWGPGFKFSDKAVKNAEPEAEGGRGLFIMKELADEFSVRRMDDRNVVSITKTIGENQWMPCE